MYDLGFTGSSMLLNFAEVVGGSPENSGDKFEGKIVEVDYEIPPKVGMTNFTQKNI